MLNLAKYCLEKCKFVEFQISFVFLSSEITVCLYLLEAPNCGRGK